MGYLMLSKTYAEIPWSEVHQLFTLKISFDAADISIFISLSLSLLLMLFIQTQNTSYQLARESIKLTF